jgi:hypothetical protein
MKPSGRSQPLSGRVGCLAFLLETPLFPVLPKLAYGGSPSLQLKGTGSTLVRLRFLFRVQLGVKKNISGWALINK